MPVYDGHRMRHGNRIAGPAMIEQVTTDVFVSRPYDCARATRYGTFRPLPERPRGSPVCLRHCRRLLP